MKFPDSDVNMVSVVSQPGDVIADTRAVSIGPAQSKIDITEQGSAYWFWTDGARWVIPMTNGI